MNSALCLVHQTKTRSFFQSPMAKFLLKRQQQNQYQIKMYLSSNSEEPIVLINDNHRGIRRLTMNNPKKRNALSLKMIAELNHHITETEKLSLPSSDSSNLLRALVLSSNADKIFSSGHDLKELASNPDREYRRKIFDEFGHFLLRLRDLPIPVICQVDGLAAAAGCQLVASCDIVLATERSQFSTPGANFGLFCSTPGIALSRSCQFRTAAYMVLTGRPITANQALMSGLVTVVSPTAHAMEAETESILESILAKSASVIGLGKKFFYHQMDVVNLEKAYSQGSDVMVNNLSLKDGQEGLTSFMEKRQAKWTHSNEKWNAED